MIFMAILLIIVDCVILRFHRSYHCMSMFTANHAIIIIYSALQISGEVDQ